MALRGMLFHQQLLLGLIILAATAASQDSQPNSSCIKCGSLCIPYPFGTRSGHYLDESFLINCDNISGTLKPILAFNNNLEVLNISLNGELKVSTSVTRRCSGFDDIYQSIWSGNKFPISHTRNKFTAIGCPTNAVLVGDSQTQGDVATGCTSICSNDMDNSSSCSGIGCCHNSIPEGITTFSVSVSDMFYSWRQSRFNTCILSFVGELEKRHARKLTETKQAMHVRQKIVHVTIPPTVLDIVAIAPQASKGTHTAIALSVSCSLRLFWHSSAASTISGIAPPPPSEFRCARCRQRLNNRQRLTAFVGTPSPGFQSKHLHHHWKALSKTISAAQKSPPSDAGRAATRRSKNLPAVTPRHAPHAPGSIPFIKGRKLWFYVTGEMKKPVKGSSEDENAFRIRLIEWDSNNHQILTWLRNTSIPSISNLLGNFDDARTAWDMLAKRYSSSHGTREYQLSIEQYQIRQDPGQSINDFFARFQFIWDQLDLSDPPWDTPNDAMKYATRRDQMRLYQFLMALHDDYEPVRGQLLHQLPTPSLDAALNDLVREETRLQTLQAQNKLNVLATTSPLAPLQQSDSDQSSLNTRRSDRKSNKFCRYCKKHGHTIETCFRRNRSTAAVTHGDTDQTPTAAVAPAHSGSAITLTTDQLEDIIAQALVRAGNASSSSALSVLPGKFSSWLLDSACCNHMTPSPSFFSHTSSARHAPTIHTANGSTMLVRSIGTVSTSKLSISDVFHDPRTGQELGTGRRIGRLFEISSLRLPATGVSAATSSSPSLSLWHSRHRACISFPGTSQQNGRAERKLRHILDTVRALLLSSKVPVPFWGEAVLTAAHAINRIPSPTISNQTPYERLFGSPPHYQHLRSFGSACFVLLQPHEHNKLEPRSRLCCFLGYGETQKGYRCYDPIAHRLRISRHVVFWEHRLFTEVSQFRPSFSLSSLSDLFPEVSPPSLESFPPSPEVSTSIPQTESSDHSSGSSSQETPHSSPESPAPAPSEDPAPATTLRRSSRVTTLPSHLRDFHCYTALATLHEPHSYREASSNPLWQAAMAEELDALSRTRTWDLVDLPPEKSVVGCKWVFKIKTRSDGSIERYKARLVAKGFTQEYGIDYEETFAPVARLSSVRTLLAVAASRQWKLFQMDVKNAFLNGDLSEEVYMQPPPGLSHPPDKVCRLRRALYGLKQAPRAWFAKFSSTVSRLGFSISSYDSALFLRRTGKGTILLLLYVDDMIITGDDLSGIQELKAFLSQNFEMKDLGHLNYFLGLEITSSDDGFYLTQAKYTSDLLSRAGLTDHKILDTPIEFNARLTPSSGELLPDPTLYRQLVGSLVYLTVTRPDISYAVHQVSQFMSAPRSTHYAAVLRILRYLKGTLFHGLHFSAQSPLTLRAYSDADWAQEILLIVDPLLDLGVSTSSATPIYCDNRSAIQIARNDVFHERTKHIEIDCHLVRHHLLRGSLQLISVSSHDQLADIFTKSHPTGRFRDLVSKLQLVSHPPP
uniref:Integrase catalytic domain-containing protein n=1 Tax=Fagus sylvatica TaxID=28930 RepID=A0A2N9HTD6_FAGSY